MWTNLNRRHRIPLNLWNNVWPIAQLHNYFVIAQKEVIKENWTKWQYLQINDILYTLVFETESQHTHTGKIKFRHIPLYLFNFLLDFIRKVFVLLQLGAAAASLVIYPTLLEDTSEPKVFGPIFKPNSNNGLRSLQKKYRSTTGIFNSHYFQMVYGRNWYTFLLQNTAKCLTLINHASH